MLAYELQNVLHAWLADDRDHRFGLVRREGAKPSAFPIRQ